MHKSVRSLRNVQTGQYTKENEAVLSEVLAMWLKLTADWLISLSVVTVSSAIVYWRRKEREQTVDVFIGQLEHH